MADSHIADIIGISEDRFQVDEPNAGPMLKNTSGVMDVRNSDDTAYARVKAGAALDNNDLVTLKQFKSTKLFEFVSAQADTSVALPTNTAAKRMLVVTTAGTGAAIGDLLYDNGTSTGSMEIITAQARTIHIPVAFSGGTITFDPDTLYMWDEEAVPANKWIKVGDVGAVSGAIRTIKITYTTAATNDSATSIPAGADVILSKTKITTPYSGGATINIGTPTSSAKFQPASKIRPQGPTDRLYSKQQITNQATAEVVRASVGGTPAAGEAITIVSFTVSNA